MTTVPVSGASASGTNQAPVKSGFSSLGQGDFLRLMTVQMQQQDPFNPVDQKEMLAQMAQFSSLAGISEMGETLKGIAQKLDLVLAAQTAATNIETSGQSGGTAADPSSASDTTQLPSQEI